MRAFNKLVKGDRFLTTYWGGQFTNSNASARRFNVTPGPLVSGNYRDPNPWSYDITSVRFEYGKVTVTYPTWGGVQDIYVGYNDGANDPWSPDWSDTRNANYNRALERLNSKVRGDLDLGVSLAEFGQTKRMIANLAKVSNYAHVSGFGSGRDLANGWLQWQYGWKPLMSDVFDAANEGFNICLNQIKKISGTASSRLTGCGWTPEGLIYLEPWLTFAEGAGKTGCRICITCELPGATLDRWSSLNPVSLAWELTPYSFVVDWFYDVGSYLRAFETALLYQVRFKTGYFSEIYGYDGVEWTGYQKHDHPFPSNPPHITENFGMTKSIKRRRFLRTKLVTYPFPRPPSLKADLGAERLLSLASLLGQLVGTGVTRGGNIPRLR